MSGWRPRGFSIAQASHSSSESVGLCLVTDWGNNHSLLLIFLCLKLRICKPGTSCLLGKHCSAIISWGRMGRRSSPPSFPPSSWAPDTKEGDGFVSWVPGAVAPVYICALPLSWFSLASTIGFLISSLLFRLSNRDCSLKNSVGLLHSSECIQGHLISVRYC